jgi:uncharacterized protein (DUF1697 family)
MKTYISILRGINVGGKNIIRMNSLQELYVEMGFKNVITYIQSGNIVFQCKDTLAEKLEKLISEKILERFLFHVPVIVIEDSELKSVLEQNPFLKETNIDHTKLAITILARPPERAYLSGLENVKYLPDEFYLKGRAIYLYCPNGFARTKLNINFFENKLKVIATARNLKTLNELVKISDNICC